MDAGVAEHAEILQQGIHREGGVRRAMLVEPASRLINDLDARLEACREGVATFFGIALGGCEGVGFIRYPTGGFYRPHRDRGDDPEWKPAARRAVALVLFLNGSRDGGGAGDFDGGVLRLFLSHGDVDVVPESGLLVAFPANVLHEVTEVRGGIRDTVVTWFYDA